VKNLSVKRLASVLATAVLVSAYPAFAMAFQSPLPEGAGVEEIVVRLQVATVHSLNAVIPSVVSALVGFFTRADRNLPLNAVADIEEVR
jgi:hypothetical protein